MRQDQNNNVNPLGAARPGGKRIIWLKANMKLAGCRKVADAFNRAYGETKGVTVGKSYVYQILIAHRYEIGVLRKAIKNRKPKSLPKNELWSIDLTQVNDAQKHAHIVLGIVDAGNSLCVLLQKTQRKSSILLLWHIWCATRKNGKPTAIRTDNERVFTSNIFQLGLFLMNIRHQRTEVACPWMNGKIERFFSTLKRKLKHHIIQSSETLATDLNTFTFWYNTVRTHQHHNGLTPAEVWKNQRDSKKKPQFFSAWDGALAGIYCSPL